MRVPIAAIRISPIARAMNNAAGIPWPDTSPTQKKRCRSSAKNASKKVAADL
jgi:hypothetical protein